MAELSAAAHSGVAASERDVLLATKLHVPRQQPGFVARPRLVHALDEGLARRLILVSAPAGSGKTALLAGWARRDDRPVAWLSLDAGDNDPARFWRHAVAALDRARPGIAERVGALLGPPAPASFEGLVTALINELAAQPGQDELLLVLDDYHLTDAQQVHEPLAFLLEHLPPGVHLVLASRSDPPLPLARLRAGGQLSELRAGDLRFTAEEAAALLQETAGDALPGSAVAALAARTEGWAAGLQLAALSLQGQADPTGFVAAFSGSHRYVLDYLTDEVLEGQTGQVREFLLETSVLDRLSGGLCDAVTGRTGGQVMLERVERANLFLVPLDEVRGWWRYHHLFADLLRARLRDEQPGRAAQLHRNAAAWFEQRGLADEAIQHAATAGEMTWAARLIERHVDERILRGEGATLARWLAVLPADLVSARPRLCLAQTFVAVAESDVEADRLGQVLRAQARLDAALGTYQQALEITAAPQPAGPACGGRGVAYQRNDLDTAVGHVTEGIARCRHYGDTQALATGLATLAWVRQAQGDAAGALDAMGEAGRAAPSSGVTSLLNPVPAQRARLLLAQGDVAAAARWTQQRGLGAGDEVSYQQEREYLVLVRVLLARNRPDDAVSLLKRLHAAAVGQGRTGSVIEIRALQALALAALGEENAAVDTLAQALMLGCPQGYVRVFADEGAPMSALLARLVAAQKTDNAAARGVPLGCLARLLRAFGGPPAAAGARQHAATAVPGLVEHLTARELEILALLAAGTPNPRIAEQLVVSLDTVKKHVSHLLGKLGAANRTEAVTRARELGLIP